MKREKRDIDFIYKYITSMQYIKHPCDTIHKAVQRGDEIVTNYIKHPSANILLLSDSVKDKINTIKEAIQYVRDYFEPVKSMDEASDLSLVDSNPFSIRFIENPSENVQLAAVKCNPYSISCIKKPSENVQLAAVKHNGYSLKYIKNPSEGVRKAAYYQISH